MKKRKIVAVTVAGLVSSTALVWADTVKTINQNGTEYVSAEELSKKLGGKSTDSEDGLVISIGSNKVEIGKGSSFAKVNGEYMALDTDEVDGFVVPKATKIMKKGDSSYIPVEFLKNNKLGEYTIGNGAISIGGKVESSTTEEDKEDNTSPSTVGTSNNTSTGGSTSRPGTGGSGNSSSGSGSTNRPGTGGSGSGSGGSGSTNRPGTGGSGNSSGSNGSSGNGGSNNSGSGSGSTGNEGGNSGSNGSGGNGSDDSGSGSTGGENPGGGNGNSGSETESGGETSTGDTIQSE